MEPGQATGLSGLSGKTILPASAMKNRPIFKLYQQRPFQYDSAQVKNPNLLF
jgi:hypothetical protein